MAVNQDHSIKGHVLVVHNEDWVHEDEVEVYLVIPGIKNYFTASAR
jgi:hypothetical protein